MAEAPGPYDFSSLFSDIAEESLYGDLVHAAGDPLKLGIIFTKLIALSAMGKDTSYFLEPLLKVCIDGAAKLNNSQQIMPINDKGAKLAAQSAIRAMSLSTLQW